MPRTIEATVDGNGAVVLAEQVRFDGPPKRAYVVVLDQPGTLSPEVPIPMPVPPELLDEFMRRLRRAASDCGPPLPGTTYSREEIYD